jgi:SAM-dependent methyltransferase
MPAVKRRTYAHIGRKTHEVDASFWEGCYQKGDVFWDKGAPSPGLVDFLKEEKPKPGRVLVPGCGRGHDCRELARHGFDVTGMDISASAAAEARALADKESLKIEYKVGDCLHPWRNVHGKFDWVFEHTCFCAIDPGKRDRYVEAMASYLKAGGCLLGIFYNIQPKTGPPFGTTRVELIERFSPRFTLVMDKVPRSYPNREGKELLMLWRKQ